LPPLGRRLVTVLAERVRSQNRRLLVYAALLRLARPRPPEAGAA
jgi:hypothetical protein